MADSTVINISAVSDLASEWKSTLSEFVSSYQKASDDSTFKVLCDLGLCGDFPSAFDAAMDGYAQNISSLISSLNDYSSEIEQVDNDVVSQYPTGPSGTGKRRNRSDKVDSVEYVENDMQIVTNTEEENLIDNASDQEGFFENISLSDLTEVLAVLNKVATDNSVSVDELFDDEKYGAKIKEVLLSNVKISEQYRVMVQQGTDTALITTLKKVLNGEVKNVFGIADDTTLTMKSYLVDIAKENNVSYEDLLQADTNSSVLKTALAKIKEASSDLSNITKDNVQSQFLAIYDGDSSEFKNPYNGITQNIVKSEVDIISSLTDISYEELLTTKDYSEELFKSIERLQRSALYAETLSNCKNVQNILSSIIK